MEIPATSQRTDRVDQLALVIAAIVACGSCAYGQHPVRPSATPAPQVGPYAHTVQSASSADGLTWKRDAGVRLSHASVPSAITRPGEGIRLYFVDADRGPGTFESTNCATSMDGINFTKTPIFISGQTAERILDPCIVSSGSQLLLYHLAAEHGPADPSGSNINLAVSDDGIRFTNRGTVFRYPGVVDPDVFFYRGRWFMYVFSRNQTIIAVSDNGASFRYSSPLSLPGWGTTAPIPLPDGRLRLYAFDQRMQRGNKVCSFVSSDGISWVQEDGVRLTAGPNEQITDPYVVPWQNGYKMYFKVQPATQPQAASRPQTTRRPTATPAAQRPQRSQQGMRRQSRRSTQERNTKGSRNTSNDRKPR